MCKQRNVLTQHTYRTPVSQKGKNDTSAEAQARDVGRCGVKAGIQINPRGARFNLFPGRRKQKAEIPARLSGWHIKRTKISTGEGAEKGEPCALMVGTQTGAAALDNRRFLRKLKRSGNPSGCMSAGPEIGISAISAPHVPCSTVHHSRDMQTASVFHGRTVRWHLLTRT